MNNSTLYKFRVSKYNSDYRKDNIYTKDEWTSICDVGKSYDGNIFTFSEYILVENKYLSFVEYLCKTSKVSQLQIMDLEDYLHNCADKNKSHIHGVDKITKIVRDCLREKYWCKLQSDNFYLHFGYDFYIYGGCLLDSKCIKDSATKLGLYIEEMDSPYSTGDSTGDG